MALLCKPLSAFLAFVWLLRWLHPHHIVGCNLLHFHDGLIDLIIFVQVQRIFHVVAAFAGPKW